MDGTVRLQNPADALNYAPGDLLGSGEMVLRVDPESGVVTIGKATWWRRARHWLRARAIDSWRWLRCTLADGWERVTGGEP